MDGSGALFAPFIAAIGNQVRVVVIRYPTTGPQQYEALVNHVRNQVQGETSFVLLAESFSGPVGISLTAERPAGLKALVLCATFARNPRPMMGAAKRLARLLPAISTPIGLAAPLLFNSGDKTMRAAFAEAISDAGPHVLRDRLHAVTDVDVTAKLEQIGVPCLYLQATRDRLVPHSAARLVATHLPRVQIERIDAPHFLLQSAPAEAALIVAGFMRNLD
jgi:pimeloyl-ACP methyl ester carboxylesterase